MGLELAGKTFGGYRVGDVLDSGPQGALYTAEHSGSGDKVAIKVYAVDLSRDKSVAVRVVADVQKAVAVTHPNLMPVREVGTAEFKGKRHLFVAMERVPGESLKSLLAKQKGQPLPLPKALHITSEIGAALEAIHRGNQVHRQLHAGAVFVAPGDGERDDSRVVLLDLGAALVPTDDKKAKSGGKVQDDLRALAQLAYSMLGGGDAASDANQAILPLRLRNRAVPARLDAVLRSVLSDVLGSGDKAARYDSASAFVAALLGTGETRPKYASWSEDGRTLPPVRKGSGTLLWAGILAVAGGLALGYFLFPSDSGPSSKPTPPVPIVDRVGPTSGGPANAADAGSDAGSQRAPGPGNWPPRSGGAIPEVRAADPWPANAAPATAPIAAPNPATPAVAKPPAAMPASPVPAATPAVGGAPVPKPVAAPAAALPVAPGATPTAGKAVAPTGVTGTGTTATPATTTPVKPGVGPQPGAVSPSGPANAQTGSKPTAASGPGTAPVTAAKPANSPTAPAVIPGAGQRPAVTPGPTAPAGLAKPGLNPGATAPVGSAPGAVNRPPSGTAAPAGAVSAAKTPEPRPSSTGNSAPAAKPATNPGGANGQQ